MPAVAPDEQEPVGITKPTSYPRPGNVELSKSGIWIPQPGRLAAWIKMRGEPTQVIAESPEVAFRRWLAFRADEAQDYCIFHEYATGRPCYYFRNAIAELAYIQITFQSAPPRETAGSYWTGECVCEVCEADRPT